MAGPGNANVHSIDALRDVRLALISFGERANSALEELRTKIDRTLAWLEQDRPMYWREQERRAYDRVAGTRVAYETCKMKTVGGRHPECIEEKVAFQRAKERLEYCKSKIDIVRRWCIEAGRQVDEYRGRSSPLKTRLDEDIPNVVAMLARMLDALEAYADIQNLPSNEASVSLGTVDDESETTVEPEQATETIDKVSSSKHQEGRDGIPAHGHTAATDEPSTSNN